MRDRLAIVKSNPQFYVQPQKQPNLLQNQSYSLDNLN